MSVRSSLDLNDQMVPLIVERLARHSRRMPLLPGIIPNVPFVAAGNAAFVSPNVGFAVDELIDIELKGLGSADVVAEEIYIVDKVVRPGVDAVIGIRYSLRRERPDQVVIPKYVGIIRFAADGELHGFAAERGRTYALTA